ncbi:MAG: rhomboid family intramembrane serine protease [Pseudonocardia sp.]
MSHPTGPPNAGGPPSEAPVVCVRHPDRATALRCVRCDRPSCPECLREASVGYQCVDCVATGARGARRAVTVAGAEPGTRPVMVTVLIALNVAMFVWTAVQAGSIGFNYTAPIFEDWALVPVLVGDGEWWRVVTSGFLHVGPLHLAFNMLALWIIGRDLELVLGRGRFLAVYMVALLGGSAAVMLDPAGTPVAGASGAVFGIMGALAVVLYRRKAPVGQVLVLIAVNFALGFWINSNSTSISISLIAHLGGLVVGAAATAALVYAPARNRVSYQAGALTGLAVLLLVLMTVAGSVTL